MSTSHQAQAVLLLTARLGRPAKTDPKPLGPSEWGRFAQWLMDRGMAPEDLLQGNPAAMLAGWVDHSINVDRIQHLLGRAGVLGLSMERWERAGLWVMTRADADYPWRLKKRLGMDSPPFFFGCGSRNLLNQGGIAIVGSREASDEDLAFTSRLGAQAAREGMSVVSGGARGVDEAAALGALESEGTAVEVLSDSLLRVATSAKYREALVARNLVLVTSFNPEAGFDVGNAMARNRYIYCLADAAVVIATGIGQGGTWNGATENLRRGWVQLWVKPSQDERSGNSALVTQGARWLPDPVVGLSALVDQKAVESPKVTTSQGGVQRSLFDIETLGDTPEVDERTPSIADAPSEYRVEFKGTEARRAATVASSDADFYNLFLTRLETLTANAATPEQLLQAVDLHKAQFNLWLTRAVEEGWVRKLTGPIRYAWIARPPRQVSSDS